MALALQPIRPVERSGSRFNRLPWYEVLLRPTCGTDPQTFVDAAYRAGDARALDLAVLATAAARMRRECHYSVNVSVASLGHPTFGADLLNVVGRTDARPDRIVIEIVGRELATKADWSGAARCIAQLHRGLGIGFAIDDLNDDDSPQSLRWLPPGAVRFAKLDVAMTDSFRQSGSLSSQMLRTLRFLGPAELVAEGVESASEHAALASLTPVIAYWQGFFDDGHPAAFSPLPRPAPSRLAYPYNRWIESAA